MKIVRTIKALRKEITKLKKSGDTIGLVPTMGALHMGHLSLIRRCRKENDITIVSIFVNPTQFGPQEDFKKYPRTLRQDLNLCQKEKVDIIFCPDAKEMYPQTQKAYVYLPDLSAKLCGKFRPGHFQGVTTVVNKLCNIVSPDTAYFGQKDAQQAIIIKTMAADLNMPVKIIVCPTIREENGLALSSRNAYLNKKERLDAPILYKTLKLADFLIKNGATSSDRLIAKMKQNIEKKDSVKIDYIAIVNPETLEPVKKISGKCLLAIAAWIGKTRLIDNIIANYA